MNEVTSVFASVDGSLDCDGEIIYAVLIVAPYVRPLLILGAARGMGRASIVDAKSDSTLAIYSTSLVQAAIL